MSIVLKLQHMTCQPACMLDLTNMHLFCPRERGAAG